MGFDWPGSSGSGREKFHFAYLWLSQELCWNSGLHLNLRDYSEGRPRESAVENMKTRWVLTGTDVRRLGSDWEERSEREPGPQSPDRSHQLSIRLEFGSSEPEPGWDGGRWGMGRGEQILGVSIVHCCKDWGIGTSRLYTIPSLSVSPALADSGFLK